MFYSHEILTDRKHGVATIWLVATLGSRSSLKKITRKAIMDVDVPNACSTITNPSAPLALRTQSNLLFGVSKVFSQQCAYVLTDMQNLRDKMRSITLLLRELEIDPDVATTRPEQLNLQADPGFNLELDLGFDLSSFDVSFSSTDPSSLMSPRTLASSQSSFIEEEHLLEEPAPLRSTSSRAGEIGFDFDNIASNDAENQRMTDQRAGDVALDDEILIAEDAGFDIEEDGSLIIRNPPAHLTSEQAIADEEVVEQTDIQDFDIGLDIGDDNHLEVVSMTAQSAISGNQNEQRISIQHLEENLNLFDDVDDILNADGPLPKSSSLASLHSDHQIQNSIEQADENHPSTTTDIVTGAAHQRTRQAKTIPIDDPPELPNRILGEWSDTYLNSMITAHQAKAERTSIVQAKRNAAYWVLDQGVGGVDADFRDDQEQHPLAIFSGQNLLDLLKSSQTRVSGRKRTASAVAEGERSSEERRVRSRSGEQQADWPEENGQVFAEEDQGLELGEDDLEPEIGREAQPPLPDHPDSMPWNIYASSRHTSRHGSVRPATNLAAASSSIGKHAGFDFVPSSLGSKRISGLLQESPLEQRRRLLRRGSAGSADHQMQGFGGTESFGGEDFGLSIDDDELDRQLAGNLREATDFELYDAPATISTQEPASSQWLAATLEQEALNFLTFLQTTLEGKQADMEDDDAEEDVNVTFEELLPPRDNNEVVAAQGLLHVLALATKGLISVSQEVDFGDISMSVVSGITPAESEVDVKA